jgi:hypothetical protein
MDRRRGTRQIVNFIDLHEQWEADVVAEELKVWVTLEVRYVRFRSCKQVIDTKDFFASVYQAINQMGPKKACSASD